MTPQDRANAMLTLWQRQRSAGIPAEERRLPANDNRDSFERDLETIRQCMERV